MKEFFKIIAADKFIHLNYTYEEWRAIAKIIIAAIITFSIASMLEY